MSVQTEKGHTAEFIISEATRTRSRQNCIVGASQTLLVGALVAASLATAAAEATAAAGNAGNGAMGAITVDADAKLGTYVLTVIEPASNGGSFSLEGPDGVELPTGKIGVAYNGPINFTLADGATDFAAGDSFEIVVTADDDQQHVVAWEVGMTAAGIIVEEVTTGVGETAPSVIIDGDAEVNGNLLAYPEGSTLADKVEARSQLRRLASKGR